MEDLDGHLPAFAVLRRGDSARTESDGRLGEASLPSRFGPKSSRSEWPQYFLEPSLVRRVNCPVELFGCLGRDLQFEDAFSQAHVVEGGVFRLATLVHGAGGVGERIRLCMSAQVFRRT